MESKDKEISKDHKKKTSPRSSVIRFRALVIGLALAIVICAVTPFNNAYRQATPLGGGSFPLAPFFILVLLTIIIAFAGKIFNKQTWLTGKELLVIWILMVVTSGIAWTGLVRTFFINITAPRYFATMENRWDQVLHPSLPKALYPDNMKSIELLYDGLPGGRQMSWFEVIKNIPWDTWTGPILVWSGFILLCYMMMICLVNIMSRQWINNERINFPLLHVPVLMQNAYEENRLKAFFTNRFMILGMMIPCCLHLINGMHFYFPEVPQIPTLILTGSYFPRYGLFSAFYKLKIYIYPAFIGFAFLTSRQISFSFWFFFFAGALAIGLLGVLGYNIPASSLGVTFGPTLSRPEETQMIGACIVFFIFLMWLARHHLLTVLRQAFGFKKEAAHFGWISTPVSFWFFMAGVAGIIIWCSFFGVPFFVSIALVMAFIIITVVAARVVCQGGIAYFTLTIAPIDAVFSFIGPKFFTNAGLLVGAAAQKVMFVDFRESLMPSLFHACEISQRARNRRFVFSAILLTLFAGVMVSFLAMLALCHKYGIRELGLDWATRTTLTVYDNIYSLVETPVGPGHWVKVFAISGAIVMAILAVCYHRFYWWPIHPLGYLTAYSSGMRILWFSFFAGWALNALCMRYGGIVLFKKVRNFFIGLVIGDFLMGGIWAIIGLFCDSSYQVLPV